MKKILMMLVIALAAPVFAAANVSITIQDLGSGWAAINYAVTDANVVAFGLDVTVNSSAKITDIRSYFTGECNSTRKGYGIFPGQLGIKILTDGTVQSWGKPIASVNEPGAAGTGLNTNKVILELGALYDNIANKPAMSGKLCDLKVDKSCQMTIAVNGTRCGKTAGGLDAGVVCNDGGVVSALVPTMASNVQITIGATCATCKGDLTADNWIKIDDVTALVGLLNKVAPATKIGSTHSLFNKCGDMTNDNYIKIDDVTALVGCLNKILPATKLACSNTAKPTACQ